MTEIYPIVPSFPLFFTRNQADADTRRVTHPAVRLGPIERAKPLGYGETDRHAEAKHREEAGQDAAAQMRGGLTEAVPFAHAALAADRRTR